MNIGSVIMSKRKALGYTRQTLADKFNVSFQAVSKWENGNPFVSLYGEDNRVGDTVRMNHLTGSGLSSIIDGSYDFIIMATSAVLGVLLSVVVVRGISGGIGFFICQFVMWPMPVIYPFLILLTVAIPALLYRQIAKDSTIERLRQ